jgi:hypothetical protein
MLLVSIKVPTTGLVLLLLRPDTKQFTVKVRVDIEVRHMISPCGTEYLEERLWTRHHFSQRRPSRLESIRDGMNHSMAMLP